MSVAKLTDHPDFKMPNEQKVSAMKLLQEGRHIEAERLLLSNLDDHDCRMALATMAYQSSRFSTGLDILKKDDSHPALLAKAVFCEGLGKEDEALNYLGKATSLNQATLDMYARKLIAAKKFDEVIELLEAQELLSFAGKMSLGEAYVSHSELGKAKDLLEEIVKIDPCYVYAYLLLESISKDAEFLAPHIPLLEEALDSLSVSKEVCNNIHHVLGKIHEDCGNYPESLKHYIACAKDEPSNFNDTTLAVDALIKTYTQDFVKKHTHPEPVECPLVFIVGMPRSGTTLTEQILISHSKVETKGETQNAGIAMDAILTGKDVPESPKEALELYIGRIGHVNNMYVLDKMPANYRFIGAMHILFPKAKFINVQRDPLNNCFSCFTTQFLEGHDYSNDFESLGVEYKQYERLMKLWHDVLPEGTIIDVQYEDMVADQKKESTRILEFLGLDWEDPCGEFYKIKRAVNTASLAQVVEPIYTSSVSRAEQFGDLLQPLKDALK